MQTLITGCADPFAAEIRYHPACWRKYISNTKDEVEYLPYQHVQVQEVKQLFFNHVKNVIFEENEPRTLNGLLEDYIKMLENYNFKRCERTWLLKEMLQNKFRQSISFHNFQKNQSCIVFDVSKGGTYIEAAINFWGISEDHMLKIVAKILKEKAKKFRNMEWQPHPCQLEKPPTLPEELVKFLNWLKYPSSKGNDFMEDPKLVLLGDILLAYISNKRTNFQVNRTLVNLKYGYTAVFSLSEFSSSAFQFCFCVF